jgi:DNA-binding PadR family transcriptional regulator
VIDIDWPILRALASRDELSTVELYDAAWEGVGAIGTLFVRISYLEDAGLISTELRAGGEERGYKPRMWVSITEAGRRKVSQVHE